MRHATLWLVLVALVSAPVAAGQVATDMYVTLNKVDAPATLPPGEPQTATVTYEWTCQALLQPPPLNPIEFTVTAMGSAAGIEANRTQFTLPDQACLTERAGTGTFDVVVTSSMLTPGEVPIQIHMIAEQSDDDSGVRAPDTALDFHATVPWRGAVTVQSPPVATLVGQASDIQVMVVNTGNARSQVNFQVTTNDPAVSVVMPAPIILDSPAHGGSQTSKAISIRIDRPAGHNLDGLELYVSATAVSTKDPSIQSEPVVTTVTVADGGHEALIPGPGILVVPLLAALAAIRRR